MKYGLQIIVPGADASQSTLPKFVSYPRGFPSLGLRRLYLFEDGLLNQPVSEGYTDSSYEKVAASNFIDYPSPVRSAAGISVVDPLGLAIDTQLDQPSEFTVVACLRHTIDVPALGAASTSYLWTSDSGNGAPASASGSFTASPRPVPGARLGVNSTYNLHAIWESPLLTMPQSPQMFTEANMGRPSNFKVMAWGVSRSLNQLALAGLPGYLFKRDDADIAAAFAPVAGRKMLVGIWPRQSQLPTTGEIVGFAIYDRYLMSDGSHIPAMNAMKAIAVARGVMS